ncbi:hypothetical protein L218DRAFT_968302 [Marasmius fiardii PR-910]|nr:hypothetical protein L218DRAFT_968302 [Marasmius fiardii PR-910]
MTLRRKRCRTEGVKDFCKLGHKFIRHGFLYIDKIVPKLSSCIMIHSKSSSAGACWIPPSSPHLFHTQRILKAFEGHRNRRNGSNLSFCLIFLLKSLREVHPSKIYDVFMGENEKRRYNESVSGETGRVERAVREVPASTRPMEMENETLSTLGCSEQTTASRGNNDSFFASRFVKTLKMALASRFTRKPKESYHVGLLLKLTSQLLVPQN